VLLPIHQRLVRGHLTRWNAHSFIEQLYFDHTGRDCDVSPFTEVYKSISNVPIVSGATAWTWQETGDTFVLVFHEALWMGDVMDHTLINPNQLHHYGIHIQETTHMVMLRCTCRPHQATYIFLFNRRGQPYIWTLVPRLTRNVANGYMSRCSRNRRGILTPYNSLSLNGVGRRD
jgi:hypothetical protein